MVASFFCQKKKDYRSSFAQISRHPAKINLEPYTDKTIESRSLHTVFT